VVPRGLLFEKLAKAAAWRAYAICIDCNDGYIIATLNITNSLRLLESNFCTKRDIVSNEPVVYATVTAFNLS
jgi:hypothetical protein